MFLHQPRQRVKVPRPDVRRKRKPFGIRGARSLHGGVDVGGRSLGNRSEFLSVRRINGIEVFTGGGALPGTVDEVSEAMAVALQPGLRFFRIFRSGTVLHRHKFFSNAHVGWLDSSRNSNNAGNYAMG